MKMDIRQKTYLCFAGMLDYPRPQLADRARECTHLLILDYPEAARPIQDFLDFVQSTSPGRLEEIYTATFDVNPTCYIYAGYQLFGESFKRGEFLVRLKEKYRERGFVARNELPDHLAVLFKFLSTLDSTDVLARELVEDCLRPALHKMSDSFSNESQSNPNPYAQVLRAALAVLEGTLQAVPA
jgi:nitrate reductase delta subunit